MKRIVSYCLIVCTLCFQLLSGDSAPETEGYFNIDKQNDGTWLVEFNGNNMYVSSYFPNKPTFINQTANNIIRDPLIQLVLMIGNHNNVSEKKIIRMILSNISKEYQGLSIQISEMKESDPKNFKMGDTTRFSQKVVLDLSNEFREFVTVNIFRNPEYDIITFSRFTLSKIEKKDLEYQLKGNAITSEFHAGTEVKFTPVL